MGEGAQSLPVIESPCVGTCTLGPGGLCMGCLRTGEEIAAWLSYTSDQRRAVMDALPERAQQLFEDSGGG